MKPQAKLAAAWIGLLLLLAASVGVVFLRLGPLGTVANLGIAAGKAALIGLVFMELARPNPRHRLAAIAGALWLAILVGMAAWLASA